MWLIWKSLFLIIKIQKQNEGKVLIQMCRYTVNNVHGLTCINGTCLKAAHVEENIKQSIHYNIKVSL